jgi:hypothetical protein
LVRFIAYENGNVRCTLYYTDADDDLTYIETESIVLPIYYTKFLCSDDDDIPDEYLKLALTK